MTRLTRKHGIIAIVCLTVFVVLYLFLRGARKADIYLSEEVLPPKARVAAEEFLGEMRVNDYDEFPHKEIFPVGRKLYKEVRNKVLEGYVLGVKVYPVSHVSHCSVQFDDNTGIMLRGEPESLLLAPFRGIEYHIVDIDVRLYTTENSSPDRLRTQCLKIIKEGLSSESETIRLDSIVSITRLKVLDPMMKEEIEEEIVRIALNDISAPVRASAIYSVSIMKSSNAAYVFENALDYKGPQAYIVHNIAVVELYNMGERDSFDLLIKYLDSGRKKESNDAATNAAGLHAGSEIVDLLRARLDTQDRFLRNAIIVSLVRLGEKIPKVEIESLLEDDLFDSQWQALIIILEQRDERFNRKLQIMLSDENPLIRIRAAQALSMFGKKDMKPLILDYLSEGNDKHSVVPVEDVKLIAITALREIGDASDISLLRTILYGKDERLAKVAAYAIVVILDRQENDEGA